jgi:fructan beta-fructosidase
MKNSNFARTHGQSNVEIALLLVMVALVAVVILPTVGVRLDTVICQVAGGFGMNTEQGCTVGSQVSFSDDFSKDAGQWDFLRGKWKFCSGRLCAASGSEYRAFAKNSDGADYTISADAILDKGNGYGIFFRASGGKKLNGYSFQYDPGYGGGKFIMRKWINGAEIWPPFATASPPPGYRWSGVERHVEVTTSGNTFTAKIDGQVVLTGKDSTYKSGQAGLRVRSPSQASFDNFKVTTSSSNTRRGNSQDNKENKEKDKDKK